MLKPHRLFISFARTKETKQRKFAVCTFLPTPALFSAKQKELATLKQLFVFYAPKSASALRQKSEAGPYCFFTTSLRSLGCGVFFFCFALFFPIYFISFRPPWKSVKKFVLFYVKKKKLFERSEFFLFSGEKCRSRQKSADGEFSLLRFFVRAKK